jgi:DNA-binding transcriptional MerR regulator
LKPIKDQKPARLFPEIPCRRYFTIGEASDLCDIKPHILRYWEQEFPQLSNIQRRGNRRYYQQHDIEIIRTIYQLLYEQGYTISGARQWLKAQKKAAAKPAAATDSRATERSALIRELESILAILDDN